MNEQPVNTISVTVYTPSGTRAYINFGSLIPAAELDAQVAALGYLVTAPGLEPGEVTEPILYVCRLDHFDTQANRDVPHIAFYSESEWLTKRWLHKYLDKPEDVEAFETATGLTVDKMPVWGGEVHPERNSPKAIQQGAMIRLAKPIRIARETYTNKEGEIRHKLKRYVDTIGKPQATPTGSKWTDDERQMEWLKNTVTLMRNVYGDNHVDTAKAAVKPTDFQSATEYADALENRAGSAKMDWYKNAITEASKFLYTEGGEYNVFKHTASIDKRLDDTGELGIHVNLTLLEALNRLIRYRALHDLFLDTGDYPKIFGIPFEDYVDKHGHVATWQRMNQYFAAQLEPAKPKAS